MFLFIIHVAYVVYFNTMNKVVEKKIITKHKNYVQYYPNVSFVKCSDQAILKIPFNCNNNNHICK